MTYDPYNPKQPGDPYGQQPPYGQPGQYGQQPMYGYPPPPKSQTNAILALVLSLVGFATCGVTSIVGVIFGHIAMGKIKRGEEEGHGMALAGIIVGYVVIVGYLLFIAFYVFAIFAAVNGGYR
ncbi:DUF4190 domain-containing protein [Lentzea flaviverrucosa]|jgi:uncharacterized BrkB/YihY/UPF0761 family membrane protein|uniref:DUF4190 domain-containing protein n=1 Tax=Lentzea flaviverrucosa TaxID=200379 RepID=A0A1H9MRW1_9PSEU|nr:DUF4190 domain-containing protein [Lentzea flaviverrucosa]RDI30808.1 uncharacterized protein DUF4190 [Lentzea flaviverrucosa]SER26460.1 protein of unknown function [Lentzea flaviverrucosa]